MEAVAERWRKPRNRDKVKQETASSWGSTDQVSGNKLLVAVAVMSEPVSGEKTYIRC